MLTFYSRILVAYDSSDLSKKALDMALTLAKQDERVQLIVTYVINTPVAGKAYGFPENQILEAAREESKKLMEEMKEKLNQLPNKSKTVVLEGDPGQMITEISKNEDVDLILIGKRGMSSLQEFFMGSVSHHVVQKAHCPVIIVK